MLSAEGQYEYKCYCPGESSMMIKGNNDYYVGDNDDADDYYFGHRLLNPGDPDLDRALANATAIIRRALPYNVYKPPGEK